MHYGALVFSVQGKSVKAQLRVVASCWRPLLYRTELFHQTSVPANQPSDDMIKVNPSKSFRNLSAPEEKKGAFDIGKVEMFFHETQLRIQPLGEEQ